MRTTWWCAAIAAVALGGCGRDETLAEWCQRNPGFGGAPALPASSFFIEGVARFEAMPLWSARMLSSGFSKVETTLSSRADEPYRSWVPKEFHRSVFRFTHAKDGDRRCDRFDRILRISVEGQREKAKHLPPGTCIALDFAEATSSEVTLYLVDIRPTSPFAKAFGLNERRFEYQLRDLPGDRVHARFYDAGYAAPTRSGSQWVSCQRDDDARRLAALVVPR